MSTILENIEYKFILITLHDNDFYMALDKLGGILVHSFGDKIVSDKFDKGIFLSELPVSLVSIEQIVRRGESYSSLALSSYFRERLKVLFTKEDILNYFISYGMSGVFEESPYINPIFQDNEYFKDVVNKSANAEVLLIKFAYDTQSKLYIEDGSQWTIV